MFTSSLAWTTSERSMANDYIVTTTGTEISLSEDANSVASASLVWTLFVSEEEEVD